jgi:hypothetical protein
MQSPIGATGATTQTSAIATHAERGGSGPFLYVGIQRDLHSVRVIAEGMGRSGSHGSKVRSGLLVRISGTGKDSKS